MAKVTGVMPKKKGAKKVVHFRGTRAGNGWTIHHEVEPDTTRKPGGGNMMMPDSQPKEPMVFSGPKANKQMLAHVAALANQGDEEDTAEPMPAGQ